MLDILDYITLTIVSVLLIFGFYQFYFWCQINAIKKPIKLYTFVDKFFPYSPIWVWIYSFFYYPFMVIQVFTINSFENFLYLTISFFILVLLQMFFFIYFPVETPNYWRKKVTNRTLSEKFLKYIHKFDRRNNCFPSMHTSIATLTALHIGNSWIATTPYIYIYPLLIGLSCLYTKQHYFLDVIAGGFLGWIVFQIYLIII